MKLNKQKNSLTREQAMELYDDLEKSMASLLKSTGMEPKPERPAAKPTRPAAAQAQSRPRAPKPPEAPRDFDSSSLFEQSGETSPAQLGKRFALLVVVFFAVAKIATAGLEVSGVFSAATAEASLAPQTMAAAALPAQKFSREEMKVLSSLDDRRAQLEERSKKLDDREHDIDRRDQEFAVRLNQLREMTSALKADREKDEKKRNSQIEQLANVYGSMDPKESAGLIEQLDVTIALQLIQKMPEKRIGQILGLMSPERALAITKMLSGRAE